MSNHLFPLSIVTRDKRYMAIMIDGTGRCMFNGKISGLYEVTKMIALPGEKVGDGWRYWRTFHGEELVDAIAEYRKRSGASEASGGSREVMTAAKWIWEIRERLRPQLKDVVRSKTTDCAKVCSVARVEAEFESGEEAKIFHREATRVCVMFNQQYGLPFLARVEGGRSNKEVTVVVEASDVRGPKAFLREHLERAKEILSSAGLGPVWEKKSAWSCYNPFLNETHETPYTLVMLQWEMDKNKYQWKRTKEGSFCPVGDQWLSHLKAMSAAAKVVETKADIKCNQDFFQGSFKFIME